MKHRKIIKHFLHYNQHFSIRKSGFEHEEEELEDFAGDNHDEGHEDWSKQKVSTILHRFRCIAPKMEMT